MTKEPKIKVMLGGSAVLIGIGFCVCVWFFLREHQGKGQLDNSKKTFSNNGGTMENRKTEIFSQDPRTSHGETNRDEKLLTKEQRLAQLSKAGIFVFEDVLTPAEQKKMLEIMDSPEYLEMLKNVSTRNYFDFWESKGFSVPRGYDKSYRMLFPTGEPVDYEPEMRLKVAELFLAAEPVDITDPVAMAHQRIDVYEALNNDDLMSTWYSAQFQEDWDGVFLWWKEYMQDNPALVWMTDVQRNAASIVAAAETAGVDAPETQAAAPSWDLSSVMENPSVPSDATTGKGPSISPPATDALARPAIPNPETDAAATRAPNLTDVPKAPTALPTVEGLEASLKEQFSSERFERAMSTLDRYGPEEGLRRLRENDPEVANQIEQYHKQEEVPR